MAGKYDGEIRINTKIDTKDVSSQMMSLENRILKASAKLDSANKKLKELGNQKIATDEFKKLEDEAAQAEQVLAKAKAELEEMQSLGFSNDNLSSYVSAVDVAEQKLSEIVSLQREMQESGKAYVDPKSTKEYQEQSEKVEQLTRDLDVLVKKEEELGKKSVAAGNTAKKQIEKVSRATKEHTGKMSKMFGSMARRFILNMLIFNIIRKIVSSVSKAFSEGVKNMIGSSDSLKAKMSALQSSIATLKNAFGGMVEPILQAVIPALTTLINWLTSVINKIAQFIALLSGQSTWKKATQQQVKYGESVGESAKNAKELNKQLSGLDELNVISSEKDTSSSGGGDGASGAGELYEEVPISNTFTEMFDNLREKFPELAQAVDNFVDSLEPLKSFAAEGLDSFYKNMLVPLGKWTMGKGLPTLIQGLADFNNNVDWEKLNNALTTLWKNLEPFAENVGNGLLWFYTNVLVPLATWTVSEVLPGFLNIVSGALAILNTAIEDLQPIWQWFWDNVLSPIASYTADAIVTVLNGIGDALEWISENEVAMAIVEGFAVAIGLVSAALAIYNGVMAIATAVTTGFSVVMGILTSPITLVIVAITALVAVGILLYKNWGTIKKKASEIWNAITGYITRKMAEIKEDIHRKINNIKKFWSEVWDSIKNKVLSIWNGIKTSCSNAMSNVKNGIKKSLDTIKNTWNNIWNGLKETTENVFQGIWDFIKGIINSIIGGIEAMANGVIKGINSMIKALNKLSFDIPDWIPGIGGNSFGFNLKEVKEVKIKRLAQGGITTGSTLANIGEAGREAVLPLENNLGYLDKFAEKIAEKINGTATVKIIPDDRNIFKVVVDQEKHNYNMTGKPVFVH